MSGEPSLLPQDLDTPKSLHLFNEMPVLIWPGEGETREEWEMIAGSQTCINANVNAEQNDT